MLPERDDNSRRSGLQRWSYPSLVFGALLALLSTWAIATPLFASPDEPAHLFKAYATAHGEAIGDEVEGFGPTIRQFDVPLEMSTPVNPPGLGLRCYFGLPHVSAACATEPGGPPISTAAVLPPFWYGLVGGGARLAGADTSQRVYRLVNAALCAALFAVAFAFVRRSRYRRLSPLLVVALTPMTLFLAGSVNPNGFEIAAFAVLWAMVLLIDSPRAPTTRSGLLVGALFAAVLLSRFGAGISVASGGVVVMIMLGRDELKRFLNRKFLTAVIGVTSASILLLIAWSRYAGVSVNDERAAVDWTRWHVITYTVGALPTIARQVVGELGWLDTGLPLVVYAFYALLSAVLVAGVILSRNRRLIAATVALIVGLGAVPVLVNIISAPTAGLIWQGRYSIALFVGLGVLGMAGWWRFASEGDDRDEMVTSVRWFVAVGFAITEVLAFWQALRRFSVGSRGKIWLVEPLPWKPSIQPMVLIGLNLVCVTAFCALVLFFTRSDGATYAQSSSDGATAG